MNVGAISFDAAKKVVLNILNIKEDRSFNLIPNEILNLILEQKLPFSRKSIPNWEEFSEGKKDITITELLTPSSIPLDSRYDCFVITDATFPEFKQAFVIRCNELDYFEDDDWYSEMFDEDFVQPLDMVLICEKLKLITMIHHEGQILEYRESTLDS